MGSCLGSFSMGGVCPSVGDGLGWDVSSESFARKKLIFGCAVRITWISRKEGEFLTTGEAIVIKE